MWALLSICPKIYSVYFCPNSFRKKPPSPEPSLHRTEPDRLEACANGGWTSSTHPPEPVNDTTSVRSSDFADYDDVNEQRAESVDRRQGIFLTVHLSCSLSSIRLW